MVRALAIRTMGCIRVDRITEYLCEPLAKALKDKDPYVRKTAAVCVAKLYDINSELVEEQGFLDSLRNLISDANPMVVANAVAALAEIAEQSSLDVFRIDSGMLAKLLAALNECTEWGQVFILDCLAKYEPSAKDAEDIIERVTPRLKHANSAVAMSAVKVIIKYMEIMNNQELKRKLILEKLPPPLITLLSEQKPEIQYVALRNINLIVQKHPKILGNSVKHFFCKYNDPIYVKMEKLEIMIKLVNGKNIDKVLMEFKEYATEVDIEFVRKSVLAIGRCAIKLDEAAERCIKVLLELIQTKVNYVVQEAIIVIKDIFRKYPNRYESIIATLCDNLDRLDEPEARAAMIWIIGEYSDRIDDAPELLESFVETFEDDNQAVQLQLLTAVVKLFLKRPEDAKTMVSELLKMATQNTDNPDLRDRGYVYWRLLSTDADAAHAVVLADKPTISDDTFQLDGDVLDSLLGQISTLASVYHKPPEYFVKDGKAGVVLKHNAGKRGDDDSESSSDSDSSDSDSDDSGESDDESDDDEDEKKPSSSSKSNGGASGGGMVDLLGLADMSIADSSPASSSGSGSSSSSNSKILLAASKGNGMQIRGGFARRGNAVFLDMQIENNSQTTLKQFAMKFNANLVGAAAAGPLRVNPIAPGTTGNCSLPIKVDNPCGPSDKGNVVQMAIKTDLGVAYFQDALPAYLMFDASGRMEPKEFLSMWRSIPGSNEATVSVPNRTANSPDDIKTRMEAQHVFHVATRKEVAGRGDVIYFSLNFKALPMLVEIAVNGSETTVCIKSEDQEISQVVLGSVKALLTL